MATPGPVYKVTLYFSFSESGWSETLYINYVNPGSNLQIALAWAKQYATARYALTGQGVGIEAVRVQDLSNPRVTAEATQANINAGLQQALPSTFPYVAILNQMVSATGIKRPWLIRGLPDAWVPKGTGSGAFLIAQDYFAAFNNFLLNTVLINPPLVSIRQGFVKAAPATQVGVDSVTTNNETGLATWTLVKDGSYFAGQQINVWGMSGTGNIKGLNGSYRVINYIPTPIPTLVTRVPPHWRGPYNYTAGGFVYVQSPQYVAIQTAFPERVIERKVGRPFFLERGARRREV